MGSQCCGNGSRGAVRINAPTGTTESRARPWARSRFRLRLRLRLDDVSIGIFVVNERPAMAVLYCPCASRRGVLSSDVLACCAGEALCA